MWLISYVLLWVLVIVEGIAIIALLRVFEGLHQRLEEQAEKHGIARLAPGAILTDHEFVTLAGETVALSHLWSRGRLLLLFVSVDCVPCRGLLEWIGDASRNRQLVDWDTCVLCAGRPGQVRKLCNDVRLTHEIPVVAVEYAALKQRYQIAGTPTLAIVEEDGRVVDVVVGKAEAYLDVLMRRSTFRIPV
ncbi:MAG: hypothetical protein DCC58_06760 [Chloroflexi bacterium]|nr:MAG: hypothetical protein DCC58_06760 [Chloroflexota bacterium]